MNSDEQFLLYVYPQSYTQLKHIVVADKSSPHSVHPLSYQYEAAANKLNQYPMGTGITEKEMKTTILKARIMGLT